MYFMRLINMYFYDCYVIYLFRNATLFNAILILVIFIPIHNISFYIYLKILVFILLYTYISFMYFK